MLARPAEVFIFANQNAFIVFNSCFQLSNFALLSLHFIKAQKRLSTIARQDSFKRQMPPILFHHCFMLIFAFVATLILVNFFSSRQPSSSSLPRNICCGRHSQPCTSSFWTSRDRQSKRVTSRCSATRSWRNWTR